jgi:hypothetical protein
VPEQINGDSWVGDLMIKVESSKNRPRIARIARIEFKRATNCANEHELKSYAWLAKEIIQ